LLPNYKSILYFHFHEVSNRGIYDQLTSSALFFRAFTISMCQKLHSKENPPKCWTSSSSAIVTHETFQTQRAVPVTPNWRIIIDLLC